MMFSAISYLTFDTRGRVYDSPDVQLLFFVCLLFVVCLLQIGGEADQRLTGITHNTGGGFLRPSTMTEAIMGLFENECFLSLAQRAAQPALPLLPSSTPSNAFDGLPESRLGDGVFTRPLPAVVKQKALRATDALAQMKAAVERSTAAAAAAVAAAAAAAAGTGARTRSKAKAADVAATRTAGTGTAGSGGGGSAGTASPAGAAAVGGTGTTCATTSSGGGGGTRSQDSTRRVLNELKGLVRTPLADVAIFPCPDDMYTWRVLLRAPGGSPYEGATFELTLQFPLQYPAVRCGSIR